MAESLSVQDRKISETSNHEYSPRSKRAQTWRQDAFGLLSLLFPPRLLCFSFFAPSKTVCDQRRRQYRFLPDKGKSHCPVLV